MSRRIRQHRPDAPSIQKSAQPEAAAHNANPQSRSVPGTDSHEGVLAMQQQIGNQAVQRALLQNHVQRENEADREVNGVKIGTQGVADPNTYYGALEIIKASIKGLKGKPNNVFPGWGGKYAMAPTYFRAAALRRDVVFGDGGLSDDEDAYPKLKGDQARSYLTSAMQLVAPLLERIKTVAPTDGAAWLADSFYPLTTSVQTEIVELQASELVSDVGQALANSGHVVGGIQDEQAKIQNAIKLGYDAFDKVNKVIGAVEGGINWEEKTIGKHLADTFSDADIDDEVKALDVSTALTRGVQTLKVLDAIWKVSDPEQRAKLAAANYPGAVSQGMDMTKFTFEMMESASYLIGGSTAVVCQVVPAARHLVPKILGGMGKIGGALGGVAGFFQMVTGAATYIEASQTGDVGKQRDALFEMVLGYAGLAGSAPLTAGAVATKLVVDGLSEMVIEFQAGFDEVAGLGEGFRSTLLKANEIVVPAVQQLLSALTLRDLLTGSESTGMDVSFIRDILEVDPTAANVALERIPRYANAARHEITRFLLDSTVPMMEMITIGKGNVTGTQSGTHIGGNHKPIREHFAPYLSDLEDAKTPKEVLDVGIAVLEGTRDLIGNYDAIAKTYQLENNKGSFFLAGRERATPNQ